MKIAFRIKKIIILFSVFFTSFSFSQYNTPKVTVVFIVDQFAHRVLKKLEPFLTGGIKLFLENGVVYDNAYTQHPSTGSTHVTFNTGVFAADHGIIGNSWYGPKGKKITFPHDDSKNSTVFDQNGKAVKPGRSAHQIKMTGVSEQLILNPSAGGKNYVMGIAVKDRAAIGAAGKLGKAIWVDKSTGYFTTSKAYYDEFPQWLADFNKSKKVEKLKYFTWNPIFKLKNPAYDFKNIRNYEFSQIKSGLVGTRINILTDGVREGYDNQEKYEKLFLTPFSCKYVLDLALKSVDNYVQQKKKDDKLLLWISFSSLDMVGHKFGPDSLEYIDLIYHIDKQIKKFTKRLARRIKKRDTLFVLTADHGVERIIEILQKDGLKDAVRINASAFIKKINDKLKKRHEVSDIIANFKAPQFFLYQDYFDNLKQTVKADVVKEIKKLLFNESWINSVWTYDELKKLPCKTDNLEQNFKNLLFHGRSGYITVQLNPYVQLSKYKYGSSHMTPYEDNTHVPLIIFQKNEFENKTIKERVSVAQIANTLSQAMNIPKAPASTYEILPGLFTWEDTNKT